MSTIVLAGFMGAGKTTVGRELAERLGRSFVDSDEHIEAVTGRAIRDIFAGDGEAEFRRHEREAVRDLVGRGDLVLAVGGGALEDVTTQQVLRGATVLFLDVSYDVAMARVGWDDQRPMLRRPDLPEIYARRRRTFRTLADTVIMTDGQEHHDVVMAALAYLEGSDQ